MVVVGSGGGGITGSVRLADAGKQVILLEKNEKTGGTTSYGGMFVNFGGHRLANEAQWAKMCIRDSHRARVPARPAHPHSGRGHERP